MSALPAEPTESEAPSGRPRDLLREYVRNVLYMAPIGKEQLPPLTLPWPGQMPRLTDADVYTAGPGGDDLGRPAVITGRDPVTRSQGNIIPFGPGPTIGSPMAGDPTGRQAARLDAWREYLGREAREQLPPRLIVECAYVERLVMLLGAEDQVTLSELGQNISSKRVQRRHSLSAIGVSKRRAKALDHLLALVYRYMLPRR